MAKIKSVSITLLIGVAILAYPSLVGAAGFKFDGSGVRPLSMGGAFVAIADDANAPYYNPAGLANLTCREETFTHGQGFDGIIKTNYIAVVQQHVGFSYLGQGGDLESKAGKNNMSERVYTLSVGRRVYPSIALGANLNLLSLSAEGKEGGLGAGLDLSVLYQVNPALSAGLSVKNLAAEVKDEDLDIISTFGVALRINPTLLIAADINNKEDHGNGDRIIDFHLGTELTMLDFVTLRVGVSDNYVGSGVGIGQDRWALDFAYLLKDSDLDAARDAFHIAATLRF